MSVTLLSIIELALLVAGAFGARALTRWLSKGGDHKVVLMAAVASWFVMFGMIPFLVFALSVRSTATTGRVGPLESLVLNVIPFALVAAPLIGFGHGMKHRKRSSSSQ